MKILIVTQYFWPENFRINDLAKGMIERGHEVDVYTGLPNYPKGKLFKGYNCLGPYKEKYYHSINVYRAPLVPRGPKKGIQLFINYISFAFFSCLMAPLLIRGKYDRIFVYQTSPVFIIMPAIILKYFKKAPIYLWVNDLWPETLVSTSVIKSPFIINIFSKFIQVLYKHCDHILVTSKGFVDQIVNQNVCRSKIIYWPQWAENLFSRETPVLPSKEILDEMPDGFKVMFAGNIGTSQSFETIIEAASILKEKSNIQWVILGDGLQKKWGEREKKIRGLKNIHFLGSRPIEKMPEYFSQADVLLASLKKDPLFKITVPGKIQAYLASQRPIIASMDGEGAQIIREAKAGTTASASNAQELAEAVLKMSNYDESDLNQMGKNGFNYFNKNFEREKLLNKLENMFEMRG